MNIEKPTNLHGQSCSHHPQNNTRKVGSPSWLVFLCLIIPIFGWIIALIKLIRRDPRAASSILWQATISFIIGGIMIIMGILFPLLRFIGWVVPLIFILDTEKRVASGEIYFG